MKKSLLLILLVGTTTLLQAGGEPAAVTGPTDAKTKKCQTECQQVLTKCQSICDTKAKLGLVDVACKQVCQTPYNICSQRCVTEKGTKSNWSPCKSNDECVSGKCQMFGIPKLAVQGICVPTKKPVAPVFFCTKDADCKTGQTCRMGTCITPTVTPPKK